MQISGDSGYATAERRKSWKWMNDRIPYKEKFYILQINERKVQKSNKNAKITVYLFHYFL